MEKLSLLLSDGSSIDIDVEEGFYVESDSKSSFKYEVKVLNGVVSRKDQGH